MFFFFFVFLFFFNDTATTEIYTLSLHDALPISDALTKHFEETGGALEPLTGLMFEYDESIGLYLHHPFKGTRSETTVDVSIPLGFEIFQQQAAWFEEHGKSQKVLEQKLIEE